MKTYFEKLNISSVSVSKPRNEPERQNEDAVICRQADENTLLLGLADGAGGYGAFSGDWAKALLDNLPTEPLRSIEEMQKWIWQWGKSFYDIYSQKAKTNDLLLNKFYEQGSAATLVAMWIVRHQETFEANYLCYGDSALLGFDLSKRLIFTPPHLSDLVAFDAFPFLVNWIHSAKNLNPFAYSEKPLVLETAQDETKFAKKMQEWQENDIIANDDCSLIVLHL